MDFDVATGVAITMPVIKIILETWLKPKLNELREKYKFDNEFELSVYAKLYSYLNRSYENQLIMNTIVFKNMQKKIDDLYIPLSIVSANKIEKVKVDSYIDKEISKFKKILIVDNAGMGKSTIMKWLFICCIRENKGIPIFIDLKRLKSDYRILDFITKELNGIDSLINQDYIIHLIKRGDFVFFLDGFDEIATADKQNIINDIEGFIDIAQNNDFIISSRDESMLSSFGDFMRFNIAPLRKDEAYELIKKYDVDGDLSKELIIKLKNDKTLKLLHEFLQNPMMTSLLYKAYEYKRVIPYKKHIFYRQVYNALFDEHDLSKGGCYIHPKKSSLDIEDFQRVLREFAFRTMIAGFYRYEREDLVKILDDVKKNNDDLDFEINKYISDCIVSVPLFASDGLEYKWVHKSFQEYFSALYIKLDSYDNQRDYLVKILESKDIGTYYNILDFYYDIDIKQFDKVILTELAKAFVDYYNCMLTKSNLDGIDQKDIDIRIALMYQINLCIVIDPVYFDPQEYNEQESKKKFNYIIDGLIPDFKFTAISISKIGMDKHEKINVTDKKSINKLIELLISKHDSKILMENEEATYLEIETSIDDVSMINEFQDENNEIKRTYLIDLDRQNPYNGNDQFKITNARMYAEIAKDNIDSQLYLKDENKILALLDINKCKKFIEEQERSPKGIEFKIK